MNRTSLAVAILLAAQWSAAAARAGDAVDCSDANSTYEQNACADKELAKADAALNAVYQKVLARIAESDQEKPYDPKSWEEALRADQRAWVAFRDADCKGLVPMFWSGGTATTAQVLGCMTAKTEARTKDLEENFDVK